MEASCVRIQVEDISRADAPTLVVARVCFDHVGLAPGGALPFEIAVSTDKIDPRRRYSLHAHVDINGSGEIERGDLITVQTYPVLEGNANEPINVELRRV